MLYALDIFGTFAFALSGAFKAVKYELDVFGVLVLSVLTGIGGGMLRDVLLGVPPIALLDQYYLITCFGGGVMVFFAASQIARHWDLVMIADAVGLGVFTGIGALKAVEAGLGPLGVILMAVLTATGGGIIRDMMVREIPFVIRTDFYATAAVIGGALLLALDYSALGKNLQLAVCIVVTIVVRICAMRFKINLPHVKSLPASPTEITKQFHNRRD